MKAPFAYFGGKMGMADEIAALMPSHRVYIEPFFGSGAVLFAKPPSPFEIVNDIDDVLVSFWRVLRERPGPLAEACALSPHSRSEFVAALDPAAEELERARRFWVRINQSFAKTGGTKTGWSITTGRTQSVPGSIMSRLGRFSAVAERLAGVSIECCDAADLVDRLATPDTVVYADPPYLADTRVMRSGNAGDYRRDMATAAEHERLAEVLTATPAKVVLSGYPSPLYDQLYGDWVIIDREVTAFSSNAVTSMRTGRVERLWLNYEPRRDPTLLDEIEAS